MLGHGVIQCGVLGNDRGREPSKLWPGIDPEIVGEHRPGSLIRAQGVTLSTGAVERQHQLGPSPLAQRCIGYRGFQLADDLCGPPRREQRVGAVLDQGGVPFDPACPLRNTPAGIGQFGSSAPQGQRLLEADHGLAGIAARRGVSSRLGGPLVARGIHLRGVENPARSLGEDEPIAQRPAQRGDVSLQRLGRSARRLVTPEQIDQRFGRHDRTAVQTEHREDRTRFGARDCDRGAVVPGL